MSEPLRPLRHFFVDEAGDFTLFDKRGTTIVGTPGVSHTLMVGICELPDPVAATALLNELRADLLRDPYFARIPSMSPEARKTAVAFHAKDDLPEVRREVFRMLPSLTPKMIVAIRRKHALAHEARTRFELSGVRHSPDDVYDDLVARGFTNLLHKATEHRVVFAKRGKSDRNRALLRAIEKAKARFNGRWNRSHNQRVVIESRVPSEHAGIQVADYLLWALQRLYERGEDRFFQSVAAHFSLIMDLDDTREKPYGMWFKKSRPLRLETMKPVTPG